MFQIQVPIGAMPVNLILLSNATLAFVKVANFGVIFDMPESGVNAVFMEDDFRIGTETYFYNTVYEYKTIPNMLTWLKQQNLQEPNVVFETGGGY